ncbi:MAG: ribosome small subunit-dependent GTPase A [Myxococcota bacterium]
MSKTTHFDGTVVEVHGMRATVLRHDDGARVRCRPLRDRTQLAVGDRVGVEESRHGAEIMTLEPRERCLWRPVERGRLLMAAHVDRLLVVAAVEPPVRPGLLDRFLIAADAEDIDVVLVLNKVDLPEVDESRRLLEPYRALDYRVLETSAHQDVGTDALRELAQTGITVLAGHSGVGKSSLLNVLAPGSTLAVGDLNAITGRGRHTTSVTTCHLIGEDWPDGGLLVDTPGVRAFGLYGFELTRIAYGFRDLRPHILACKFRDCLHEGEPDCAVAAAVLAGDIPGERHASYLRILASVRAGTG